MVQRVINGQLVEVPATGLIGSEQALQGGLQGALDFIGRGADVAGAELQPFAAGGTAAFDLQGALSGALGPEAQAEAFANFQSSPGQDFLRDKGEQALLRRSGAIGGIGGGNVRRELVREGIGFAQQDFGDQFGRLGALSQIGLGAAGDRAGIFERAGARGGEAIFGTGRDISAGRTRAGESIARATSETGSSLADLVSGQGAGVSDILRQGTGDVSNLLVGAGASQGNVLENLAALLANIQTGTGTQIAGLPTLPGLSGKRGILSDVASLASGAGTLIGAFPAGTPKPVGSSRGIAGGGTGLF